MTHCVNCDVELFLVHFQNDLNCNEEKNEEKPKKEHGDFLKLLPMNSTIFSYPNKKNSAFIKVKLKLTVA
jgi:hypothetical protein